MGENKRFEVRRATVDDWDALHDFIVQNYGSGASAKGKDRWFWQFVDNPASPKGQDPSMWLAFDGPKVVGQIGVQDAHIQIDNDRHDAGWIVDVMVDPIARGHGLGHALHDKIMAERDVLVTLTMAEATRRIAQKAGCLELGLTGQYVRPHRVSADTVKRLLRYKSQFGKNRRRVIGVFNASGVGPMLVAALVRAFAAIKAPRKADRMQGFQATEIASFGDDHDAFAKACMGKHRALFDRSASFLNWRFVDEPTMTYRRFALSDDRGVRGLLVLRVAQKDELPSGVISEILADPDDDKAHDALLDLAWKTVGPDCEYLEAAGSGPAMTAALKRAGYIQTRAMYPTIVCSDPKLKDQLATMLDDWHFTKGDHDWDQIHPA